MANYYDVLGISRDAEEKDIRQAYRRMARQYHPDVNPGDESAEETFKRVNEAHSVLSDPEKRRKYDKWGDRWEQADHLEQAEAQARVRGSRNSFHWTNVSGDRPTVTFEESGTGHIFENLFRNLGQDLRQQPTADVPVDLTLEEAYEGTVRLIDLPGGRRLEVKIPPGVDDGSKVSVAAGQDRESNFNLVVSVNPHPVFERRGRNLHRDIEVSLEDSILGGEITVPTLRSRVALRIPPETQNEQRFRLARQGMPSLNSPGSWGDLYATVRVKLPTGLTEEEKDLFRRLKELRSGARR